MIIEFRVKKEIRVGNAFLPLDVSKLLRFSNNNLEFLKHLLKEYKKDKQKYGEKGFIKINDLSVGDIVELNQSKNVRKCETKEYKNFFKITFEI